MRLPPLKDPLRYVGLFAFDFGEWVSVGYTAEEITVLLNSEQHKHGGAFRVHRADAEGRVELAGVSPYDLSGEEMMLFASSDSRRAGDGFSTLRRAAEKRPPPCSAKLELVEIPQLNML